MTAMMTDKLSEKQLDVFLWWREKSTRDFDGIICDGAKASCAAKIAAAVDAGLLGLAMYEDGNQFFGGDGIVKCGVENTIAAVGRLARFGMEQTDKEIIELMMEH